ncbi:MAG: TetR/AcrR family transcriptional regulator [Gammaproteobacteria bacterium]|nr:TetR/AcrR family transcriptional regulator [Gammaproteobacteria bacterium]
MTLAAFREERAGQKRRAILDAARQLFAELGLSAVSMATLAQAAGVSTATLYRHFEAKEDVFACVIDELVAAFGLAESDPDEVESLASLATRYARLLSDAEVVGLLRAVIADPDHGSGFRDRLEHHGNAILFKDFEAAIRREFGAPGLTVEPDTLRLATLELRGALEHITLIPALLFHEFLPADPDERQVRRIVESWTSHWLHSAI